MFMSDGKSTILYVDTSGMVTGSGGNVGNDGSQETVNDSPPK